MAIKKKISDLSMVTKKREEKRKPPQSLCGKSGNRLDELS
jgi:hypothetical protein